MSEVHKSARAIPKCKGCGQPRKGHAGLTGLTKCQNIVDGISKMNLAEVSEKGENNRNAIIFTSKKLTMNEEMTFEDIPEDLQDNSLSIANFTISEVISAVVGKASDGADKEDPDQVLHPEKKIDSNLESARAIPKCKGCGQPRKGHTGPTGLSKCQNIANRISKMNLNDFDKSKVYELATDPQELKRKDVKRVEDVSIFLDASNSRALRLDSLSIANSTISEVVSSVVCLAHKTPGKCRISSVCDYEHFLSESAMEDLDEVLHPEKKLDDNVANSERLGSVSEDLDIRNVLREKTFLLCECEKFSLGDCGCKGILDFNDDMVAMLVDVFDFTRNIVCKKSSWKKKSPNEISLGLECTPLGSAGKSAVKGTVTLKAWRLVSLVKGKKHLSVDIKAEIEVKKLKLNKDFKLIEQEVMDEEESPVEEDEELSSEDEVPSEDSDSEVFKDNTQNSVEENVPRSEESLN